MEEGRARDGLAWEGEVCTFMRCDERGLTCFYIASRPSALATLSPPLPLPLRSRRSFRNLAIVAERENFCKVDHLVCGPWTHVVREGGRCLRGAVSAHAVTDTSNPPSVEECMVGWCCWHYNEGDADPGARVVIIESEASCIADTSLKPEDLRELATSFVAGFPCSCLAREAMEARRMLLLSMRRGDVSQPRRASTPRGVHVIEGMERR